MHPWSASAHLLTRDQRWSRDAPYLTGSCNTEYAQRFNAGTGTAFCLPKQDVTILLTLIRLIQVPNRSAVLVSSRSFLWPSCLRSPCMWNEQCNVNVEQFPLRLKDAIWQRRNFDGSSAQIHRSIKLGYVCKCHVSSVDPLFQPVPVCP